jgi:hypothetical protein
MNLTGEVSMVFAIYSTSLFIIVGLASLPSVGEAMDKKQWSFVFGPIVWLALAFGHVHYCVISFRVIQGTRELYGGIPHSTLLGSLLPWFAFFLKSVQLCVTYGASVLRKMTGLSEDRRPSTTQHFSTSDSQELDYTGSEDSEW